MWPKPAAWGPNMSGSARGERRRGLVERLDVAQRKADLLRTDRPAHAMFADAQLERLARALFDAADHAVAIGFFDRVAVDVAVMLEPLRGGLIGKLGRASCRERGCQSV